MMKYMLAPGYVQSKAVPVCVSVTWSVKTALDPYGSQLLLYDRTSHVNLPQFKLQWFNHHAS